MNNEKTFAIFDICIFLSLLFGAMFFFTFGQAILSPLFGGIFAGLIAIICIISTYSSVEEKR